MIVDPRIWRHPERIEWALKGVFVIRALEQGRRLALSRWHENGQERLAAVILNPASTLAALHVIDEQRLRRYNRQVGEMLWKRSE